MIIGQAPKIHFLTQGEIMFESKKKLKYILVDLKTRGAILFLLAALVLSGAAGCSLFDGKTTGPEEDPAVVEETENPEEEEISGDLITTITLWDCLDPRERM
ncbi:MAG: hypothetical protein MUP02_01730, partial [Actinobacteria bacterium]|nr:hypothetical protein [Actinomycetota bacterium]